jgi:hypothetical protein
MKLTYITCLIIIFSSCTKFNSSINDGKGVYRPVIGYSHKVKY